ncbi:hypothetical protein GCM10009630_15560 [Kribbella jejuensis]
MADDDLFAVRYLAGEVEGGQVDAAECAAGQGEDVGYAGAERGADETGAPYLAGYVDDYELLVRWGSGAWWLVEAGLLRLVSACWVWDGLGLAGAGLRWCG